MCYLHVAVIVCWTKIYRRINFPLLLLIWLSFFFFFSILVSVLGESPELFKERQKKNAVSPQRSHNYWAWSFFYNPQNNSTIKRQTPENHRWQERLKDRTVAEFLQSRLTNALMLYMFIIWRNQLILWIWLVVSLATRWKDWKDEDAKNILFADWQCCFTFDMSRNVSWMF